MDTKLEITHLGSDDGPVTVLTLKGPLVISNLFEFQAAVRSTRSNLLVLDMTEVPYIDSSAIGVLVGAHVSRDQHGRKLLLVGVNTRVRTVLNVTQVERLFNFADKVPDLATGA